MNDLRSLSERWIAVRNTAKPSPNTVLARRRDLVAIATRLAPIDEEPLSHLDPGALSRRSLETALAAYAVGHSPRSTQRVMSTWRQFCLWLVREDLLDSNPIDLIDGPAATSWQPKPLQPEDLEGLARVVQQIDPISRHPWPLRDTAMFALFITGGLRASELASLTIADADMASDPPRLQVIGKEDRHRTVTLPPETGSVLRKYLDNRAERLEAATSAQEALIVRHDGRALTRSAIDHLVRGWFRRAGRRPPVGALAHSLRHTYATLLIDNGASLPEVQRLLGHANLNTTQAYLGVTGKGLEEATLANPARRLLPT